jgi:hypothetical protein
MSLTTDLERTATAVTMPNSSSTSRPLMWSPVQHDNTVSSRSIHLHTEIITATHAS